MSIGLAAMFTITTYQNFVYRKLNELIERGGGSGLGICAANLWHLKNGKFVEAWHRALRERSSFQVQICIFTIC
jgi:hypothetical protein